MGNISIVHNEMWFIFYSDVLLEFQRQGRIEGGGKEGKSTSLGKGCLVRKDKKVICHQYEKRR